MASSQVILAERLPIKTYTTADGLPRDHINRIVLDSHGFLWFCTLEGLSRFDGYSFTNYTTDQGLPGRNVTDLLETRSGAYWIATSAGVCRFNPTPAPSEPMFVLYHPNDGTTMTANVLLEDHAGAIWCGTDQGVYRLDQVSSRREFRLVDIGLPAAQWGGAGVNAMLEDRQEALWFGANSGLYRHWFDGRNETYTNRNGLPENRVTALLEDRQGQLWVGTKRGLCQIVAAPAVNRPIVARVYTTKDGLAGDQIFSLFQSSEGNLWVGIFGGLSELNPQPNQKRPTFRSYTAANGLSGFGVSALGEDRDGNLWIAGDGAMKLARHGFTSFNEADGLAYPIIASIFADQTGELCVISSTITNKFIHRFDGERFKTVRPNVPKSITYFGWGWNQITFQDHNGEWWVVTGHGLYRFPKVDRVEQLAGVRPKAVYTSRNGLVGNDIFRLYEDSRGDIWIVNLSPAQSGLTRWDRTTGTLHTYSEADGLPLPASQFFGISFCDDASGNLWMGTAGVGLARYARGSFTLFTTSDGVPPGWIRALYVDHVGRLWMASSRTGLSRVDNPRADRPHFVTYTTADGLSSNDVWCITEDQWGRIYAGTGRGVDRLDPANGHIKHYTAADGLAQGEPQVAFRDRHGALWFGTGKGLSRLVPEPETPRAPPPILITGLRIAGVRFPISELGQAQVPTLELGPNQNDIQINFVGLAFGMGEMLRYQYKLEGADRDWSAPSDQRTINYANLSSGNYRFLVRAITADGVISSAPATVSFLIARPVWQRWWFVALIGLTLVTGAYAVYRNRIVRLLELERVRMRIATDLHDDIGSSLSQIAIQSEVMRQQMNREGLTMTDPLSAIANASREVVDSMSDIVWAINPKRDHLQDLAQRMRRFASDIFSASNIEFTFRGPAPEQDIPVGADVRRQVFLIFKECLNNIVRHSGCTKADIDFRVAGNMLRLTMSDNGAGLDRTQSSDGHGLTSMRDRAKHLGGELSFAADNGKGTTVALRVPTDRRTVLRWRRSPPE